MQSTKKIDQMMKTLAEAAVKFSKDNFGAALNYSEESVKLVEAVLDNLYNSIPKPKSKHKNIESGPTDNQIQSVALMMGAYIGEVIRKKSRARWHIKKINAEDVYALVVGEHETFPVNKAYKRLTLGAEDNIWRYYNTLHQLSSKKSFP